MQHLSSRVRLPMLVSGAAVATAPLPQPFLSREPRKAVHPQPPTNIAYEVERVEMTPQDESLPPTSFAGQPMARSLKRLQRPRSDGAATRALLGGAAAPVAQPAPVELIQSLEQVRVRSPPVFVVLRLSSVRRLVTSG